MLEQLEVLIKCIFELILLILNPIFSIPIFICIYIYHTKVKEYKEETYYKITKVSYFNVRHNAWKYGEYLIYKYLKDFENQGAKFLFNIYIPKKGNETTEIDVLMISSKGLFVFESKNYSGWIFGSDNQKYWYQTLPSNRGKSHKEKFYNPIFQNNTHVKYLKTFIEKTIPIYSIITFSDRCTLMNVYFQSSKVNVINRYQVYNLISSIYNSNSNDLLSNKQIEEIYNTLYPYTQIDESIKQKHIDNINNNLNNMTISNNKNISTDKIENDNIVNNTVNKTKQVINLNNNTVRIIIDDKNQTLICPLCGSKLVLKIAKHGVHTGENFYGCSNYPKCKYIKK